MWLEPRENVGIRALEVLKNRLDKYLPGIFLKGWACFGAAGGLGDFLRTFLALFCYYFLRAYFIYCFCSLDQLLSFHERKLAIRKVSPGTVVSKIDHIPPLWRYCVQYWKLPVCLGHCDHCWEADHIPVDRSIRSASLQNVHVENHTAVLDGFLQQRRSSSLLCSPLKIPSFPLRFFPSQSLPKQLSAYDFSLLSTSKVIVHSLLTISVMGNSAVSSCQWNILPELTVTSSTAPFSPQRCLARHLFCIPALK